MAPHAQPRPIPLLPLALIALVGGAAYANTFAVPMQFDDLPNLVEAAELHATRLSPSELARAAGGFPLHRWLVRVSFAVNHALDGLRPAGYHAVNLAFHLGAALLLFAVAGRLLEALSFEDERARRAAALVTALLFVAHPVNTQAVTYVVQRMTSMGAFFALLSLWLWLEARLRAGAPRWAFLGGATLSFALAVGCKENFLVTPALALLVEWVVNPDLGTSLRSHWRRWAIVGALLALGTAAALGSYRGVIAAEHARFGIPIGDRLLSQGRILLHYLSLLVLPLPSRLHVDYAWTASTGLLTPPTTLPALLLVGAGAAWALSQRARRPLVALAAGWFLIALSIEQSVLPIDLVFEHRLYFAAPGLFLLAGAALVRAVRTPALGPWPVAAPLVAILAVGTWARNDQWRDPTRVYAGEQAGGPGAIRNLLNLAAAQRGQGRLDEAAQTLGRAIELAPAQPEPYADLGSLELTRGRPEAAERWLRMALERGPRLAVPWLNLGNSLQARGRVEEAMAAYGRASQLDPTLAAARASWARLAWQKGDVAAARAALDEAVARDPGSGFALTFRAQLRLATGDLTGAESDARAAVRFEPGQPLPRELLIRALVKAGRTSEARAAATELLQVAPGNGLATAVLNAPR